MIAIDDLDAIDNESVNFLLQIMDQDLKNVLFIFSHLDGERDASSSSSPIKLQAQSEMQLDEIHLQPLKIEHISAVISSIVNLKIGDPSCIELSEHIFKKSGGTPILVYEIIASLREQKVFRLMKSNLNEICWKWYPTAAENEVSKFMKYGANVDQVDMTKLLLRDVNWLSASQKRIIQLAATLGTNFSLGPIIFCSCQPIGQIISDINHLIAMEVFVPISFWSSRLSATTDVAFIIDLLEGNSLMLRFKSTQYRASAYELNANTATNLARIDNLHLWGARVLTEICTSSEELEKNTYPLNCLKILHHYSKSTKISLSEKEFNTIARISLVAVKYCNLICAFETSLRIYALVERIGERVSEIIASIAKDETLGCLDDLLLEVVKIAYSVDTDFGRDQFKYLLELLSKRKTDSGTLFGIEIDLLFRVQDHSRVLIKVLSSIKESKDHKKINIPESPSKSQTRNSLLVLNMRLLLSRHLGRNRRSIMNRYIDWTPDKEDSSVLNLAKHLLRASATVNCELFLSACIRTLSYCLSKKQKTEILPLVFTGVAVAFARRSLTNQSKFSVNKALKMARISESLADLYTKTNETCHASFICLAFINHLDVPLRTLLEPLLQVFKRALKFGDTEIACQAIVCWLRYALFSGEALAYIEAGIMVNW